MYTVLVQKQSRYINMHKYYQRLEHAFISHPKLKLYFCRKLDSPVIRVTKKRSLSHGRPVTVPCTNWRRRYESDHLKQEG